MTDADWRNGRTRDDLLNMSQYLQSRWDVRREWLFGAAVLRRIWDLLTDARFRELVDTAEGWAAGRMSGDDLLRRIESLPTLPPEEVAFLSPPPPDWTTGITTVRTSGGATATRPATGVLNFHDLPRWVQQSHHAVFHFARRQVSALCVMCAAVRADHTAELVPEHGASAEGQDALHQAEARLRREEADAHHRGLTDAARVRASRQRLAELREQSGRLASAHQAARERAADAARTAEFAAQADLLRCVAGNPFAAVAFDAKWNSETVVSLARGIVADRAFDRLPILADALEEAGCDHPDVLSHCRTPGPHALGCWALGGLTAELEG